MCSNYYHNIILISVKIKFLLITIESWCGNIWRTRKGKKRVYQNIQNGIVYITADQAHNIQRASTSYSSSSLPVRSSLANLSRFNVSPPHNPPVSHSCKTGIRLPAKNKLKAKTVSWVSDRKVKAKNISEDRKIVKSQVYRPSHQ